MSALPGGRSIHADERGIITGFIVRTIVILAVLALVIEEGGQLIAAQIKVPRPPVPATPMLGRPAD